MNNKEMLTQIQQKVKEVMPSDARVLLFGSQARGDQHDSSDWDILILLNKGKISDADFDTFAYPLVELGWQNGEMVNPLLYTYNEWQKRRITPFYQNVEHEGVSLC